MVHGLTLYANPSHPTVHQSYLNFTKSNLRMEKTQIPFTMVGMRPVALFWDIFGSEGLFSRCSKMRVLA
jgi:hypothetical protein